MSNDVQSHESVVERLPGEERRASPRHAAETLGSVTARIIGGSQVDLVNYSTRGVLFECDSRLLIGARASVRITTNDANVIATGRVVRSRVKGLVNGALRYDAALALDHELGLAPPVTEAAAPVVEAGPPAPAETGDDVSFESESDVAFEPEPVEIGLVESEATFAGAAPDGPDAEAVAFAEAAAVADAPAYAEAAVAPEPAEAAEDEPVAFESDEVAFEAAGDLEFEPVFEAEPAFEPAPVMTEAAALPEADVAGPAAEAGDVTEVELAPEVMFDATPKPPPIEEAPEGPSFFHVTPPAPAFESPVSSMFDARPSTSFRDAPDAGEAPVAVIDAAAEAEGVDFESDVTFEPEEPVSFEAVFEPAASEHDVAPLPETPPALPAAAAAPEPVAASAPAADPSDPSADHPVPPTDSDDKALLPFIATVPQDLAELRRIAADNQW